MASEFLDNLKKAVENGEFNSEAAKKINQVDELATEKLIKGGGASDDSELSKSFESRLEKAGVKTVTEEEGKLINTEYERKMLEFKEKDLALQQIKTLTEIDDMIMLSISDMREFIQTVEDTFDKTKPVYVELFTEIEKVKDKYISIINN